MTCKEIAAEEYLKQFHGQCLSTNTYNMLRDAFIEGYRANDG